jgi:hypothetical protein
MGKAGANQSNTGKTGGNQKAPSDDRKDLRTTEGLLTGLITLRERARKFLGSIRGGFPGLAKKRRRVLSCKETQRMIPGYLRNELSDEELLAFLQHVSVCPDCYEELETMFMVDRTIHYLDDGVDGSFNLTPELVRDMEKKRTLVRRNRVLHRIFTVTVVIACLLFLLAVLDFFGVAMITRLL